MQTSYTRSLTTPSSSQRQNLQHSVITRPNAGQASNRLLQNAAVTILKLASSTVTSQVVNVIM